MLRSSSSTSGRRLSADTSRTAFGFTDPLASFGISSSPMDVDGSGIFATFRSPAAPFRSQAIGGPVPAMQQGFIAPRATATFPLQSVKAEPVVKVELDAADSAVAEFLNYIKQDSKCQLATAEDVNTFVALVRQATWNSVDVKALVHAIASLQPGTFDREMLAQPSRWSKGAFTRTTQGTRGKAKDVEMMSTLWVVAHAGCDHLPEINHALKKYMAGAFNLAPEAFDYKVYLNKNVDESLRNAALARFMQANPRCAKNEKDIKDMLNLIDTYALTGDQVWSIIRAAGIAGQVRPRMSHDFRVDSMSIDPKVKSRNGKNTKHSFLWKLFKDQCQDMGPLVKAVAATLKNKFALPDQPQIKLELEHY